ncbi:MAG TPA: NAD(P)H-dependent glycerol-3-phosphate dehydrogenase [Casimicrobiaceae bacterium]|jgi:glycerol-3-phosphate dehydrogenase (NAD(P)+)|nr:NAD(P)H-dependent glycerol-3-phosphate dehydrogenase [Casimicrobiaceae bacterium]
MTARIAILGAGAFGTALAIHLSTRAHAQPRVTLCTRTPEQAAALARDRLNPRYLPGFALSDAVAVTHDVNVLRDVDYVVAALPSAALLAAIQTLRCANVSAPLVWLTKGFVSTPDAPGHALIHDRIARLWPSAVGAVSGPSFASEVARGLPTALAVAATVPALAHDIAECMRAESLRVYAVNDLPGLETGGAIKNVLAIAAGASDGLGFGHNARAALITRGLAETMRLSAVLGGRRETLMGLGGLGDLVLTCTGDLSRNRQVGLALARGEKLADVLGHLGHVAEGVGAARAAHVLARHHGVDMPIVDAVHRVLHHDVSPADAVRELLRREPRLEGE